MVRLRLLLPLVASAALITSVGCDLWPFGPSKSVAGNWRFASVSPSTSRVYEMSLTQTGDSISGVVCVYNTPGPAPVREASVTGAYPRVRFTDPVVAACEYDLEFEEDQDQIAGDCVRSLVRFSRGGSGKCDAARGTATAP